MPDFNELLLHGESERLDFKRDQYPFVGASDTAKADLLQDILCMANSMRDEPAYILVGVDAPSGQPRRVVGITTHLDDAQLQQFVNSKTNRPVKFRCFDTLLQGQTVGVFEIDLQERPIFLKVAFAHLKPQVVHTRHGSSNAIASLDEIAQMGAPANQIRANDLVVGFDRSPLPSSQSPSRP